MWRGGIDFLGDLTYNIVWYWLACNARPFLFPFKITGEEKLKRKKPDEAIPVGYHQVRPRGVFLKNKKPCALIGDNGVSSSGFSTFVQKMHERGHFRRNSGNVRVYVIAQHNRDQKRFYAQAYIGGILHGMEITNSVIYSPPQESATPPPHFAQQHRLLPT